MAFLLPIVGFFGAALGSHVLGKAGISVPDINVNVLTIPINSNELPSGLIGDACNYERKTHNEAKTQQEMRENEARQRREDERIAEQIREIRRLEEEIRQEKIRVQREVNLKLLLEQDVKFKERIEANERNATRFYEAIVANNERYKDSQLNLLQCNNGIQGTPLRIKDVQSASPEGGVLNEKMCNMHTSLTPYMKEFNLSNENHLQIMQELSHIPLLELRAEKMLEEQKRFQDESGEFYVKMYESLIAEGNRAVVNVATAVGNAYIQGTNDMANTRRMEAQATQQLVSNVASAVGNAYSRGSMDMVNTRRMEAQATQQLVSNVASAVVNNAPQVIRETAEGVSSFGFEVATQVASGYNPTGLAISAANDALSSINGREKGFVETTGEAVATGVATYVGGQVGSVIATGLLVKTAIETNVNVVGNIIQEEINKYQQGGM